MSSSEFSGSPQTASAPYNDAEGIGAAYAAAEIVLCGGGAGQDETVTIFFRGDAFVSGRNMVSRTRPRGREKSARARGKGCNRSAVKEGPSHLAFSRAKELLSMCGRAREVLLRGFDRG